MEKLEDMELIEENKGEVDKSDKEESLTKEWSYNPIQ
jgi:hypothetical protein